MTTPRKLTPAPLPGHPGVTVTPMHAPGSPSGYYVVTMAPGAEMPEHAHPNAETVIACGLLEITVDDRIVLLHHGEALDIPPGVPHAVAGSHVREVRYVSIATPDWGQTAPMLVPASVVEAIAGTEDDADECLFVAGVAAESSGSDTFESRLEDAVSVAANGLKALALLTRDMPGQRGRIA